MKESAARPKLSVIVPVYNTEKYLENCLNSICRQTYQDMEIIVVNDGSTDGSADIINRLMQKDRRMRCVVQEKNSGLFCARVAGVEASHGEYIAFVDSDDTVSVDWFRLLVKKAEETDADIVMGNTICEDENHNKYIYNTYYFAARSRESLRGEAVLDSLMENEGMCFSKHTIWNKLYSRRIWEQSLPHFRMLKQHFVMTEDLAFSVVLHYHAEKLAYSDHDGYFYYRNQNSSTIATGGLEKIKKNVEDLKKSFEFVKTFLQEKGVFEKI
ncbi:MAG: glycosyltransferase [Lachnospiraceae bacterium]|nr:glycosyltransferase [Lachnospiraceae bacterium]